MRKIQGIMFDLDGTLAETIPICLSALRSAFNRYFGRHFSNEELLSYFGPTEEGVVLNLLPSKAEECLDFYYREYERLHEMCSEPFPGIYGLLEYLKMHDVRLAVITAKGEKTARISLEWLNLLHYFDMVRHGFPDANKKALNIRRVLSEWGLKAENCAYVGDMPGDMKAARETGLLALGAAWKENASREVLDAEQADVIFDSPEELLEWFQQTGITN